jgi:demethylmenaquinone methyltransferase/2-methoxy-6-polyprenyl-1,4-benzoquinol methylase
VTDGNRVAPDRIREMFDTISGVYDSMNSMISGFQEPRWRRRAVRAARLAPGMRALDVATGTGRVAADLWREVQPGGEVVGVDFAEGMLTVARERFADHPGLTFIAGDALALPVPDATFDAATIAFGMRNLSDYRQGFAELRRAVKPGGRVICLEIARPNSRLGRLAQAWFDRVVPVIGRLAGQGDAYAYLIASTQGYPDAERIAAIMREAGLVDVGWRPLTFGIVTVHAGRRPSEQRSG